MKLQEILSFLEDEEKRNRLIYKLKHAGEDSKPVHALKEIITFFDLHKTPRGIHQKTILQNTFHYCHPNECFKKFRLVCKSWQDAVETIRFSRTVSIDDWIFDYEQNGNFQIYLPKYLKIFKNLQLNITSQILIKFDSVTELILQNMTNLHKIDFSFKDDIPQRFDSFALQLLQKSKSTLTRLGFDGHQILPFPIISLPNVTTIHFLVKVDHDEHIEQFTNFVQKIVENCKYLERFYIYDIGDSIPMTEYIAQNYPENCLEAESLGTSSELPTKMPYCPALSDLPTFKYPSSVRCLYLSVSDFNYPYKEGWENYKSILALCSNLQTIYMVQSNEDTEIELEEALQNISPANQDIWRERIQYLKSYGIEIINWGQYNATVKKFSKQSKWVFTFCLMKNNFTDL